MISILVGVGLIILGLWGIVQWFPDFLIFLKGFFPLSIMLGGIVAIIVGVSSFSPARSHEKSKPKS